MEGDRALIGRKKLVTETIIGNYCRLCYRSGSSMFTRGRKRCSPSHMLLEVSFKHWRLFSQSKNSWRRSCPGEMDCTLGYEKLWDRLWMVRERYLFQVWYIHVCIIFYRVSSHTCGATWSILIFFLQLHLLGLFHGDADEKPTSCSFVI